MVGETSKRSTSLCQGKVEGFKDEVMESGSSEGNILHREACLPGFQGCVWPQN